MKRTEEIIKRLYRVENNKLKIGDFTVEQILKIYPTPLYVYDAQIIKTTYQSLASDLPQGVDIYYSLKANPSLAICNFLHRLGAGAEIASRGELVIAQKSGFPVEQIVFAGPGKSKEELKEAIKSNILMINVESVQELENIAAICKNLHLTANIGVRVNPKLNPTDSQMVMGGKSQKFGIDEEKLEDAIKYIISQKHHLKLKGIHAYVGTQIFSENSIIENFSNICNIAVNICKNFSNIKLNIIDFGCGFGIPYYKKEKNFNLSGFKKGFKKMMEEFRSKPGCQDTKIILELGRFLVAESGLYLMKVLYTRESRGKYYVIVDGGMHHNCIGTGNMGQRIPRKFPLYVVNKVGSPMVSSADVVGPLCTPLDSFGHNFDIPRVERGDIIAVFQMGAYGLTASMNGFLSHPLCGEVMIEGDYAQVIRHPGSINRIVEEQKIFMKSESYESR